MHARLHARLPTRTRARPAKRMHTGRLKLVPDGRQLRHGKECCERRKIFHFGSALDTAFTHTLKTNRHRASENESERVSESEGQRESERERDKGKEKANQRQRRRQRRRQRPRRRQRQAEKGGLAGSTQHHQGDGPASSLGRVSMRE